MHGQKRSEYKSRLLHAGTATKLATKAQQWNHLSRELLTQRRRLFGPPAAPPGGAGADDAPGPTVVPSPGILLALTEKMLSVNPDPSHLWNIRREMLLYVPTADMGDKDGSGGDADGTDVPKLAAKSSFDMKAELSLTAHCLQRNPKSYSSWYHRKWSLVYHLTHPTPVADVDSETPSDKDANQQHLNGMKSILKSELELCAQFLLLDERNFHCWNYRRLVVAILGSCGGSDGTSAGDAGAAAKSDMELFNGSWSSWLNQSDVSMGAQLSKGACAAVGGIPTSNHESADGELCIAKSTVPLSQQELEDIITNEWDFTTSKIQDNFSNGSAFHYRSKLLPLILETRLSTSAGTSDGSANARYEGILSLAREEWEDILLNAIFTEPDDQTPWWYHRFIVSWAEPSAGLDDEMVEEYEALLFEMADSLRELLEVERENGMSGGDAEARDESKGAKCKWAYIGLHLVLSTLLQSKSIDGDERMELREEVEDCLAQLTQIDPNRRERYQLLTDGL